MVRLEWQIFLLAVQFLTRLPVPRDLPFSDDLTIRAVKYYPLVGALVGVIGGAVLWAAAQVWPMPVAVVLSLAATLLATGCFHEDGLADCADGLGGGSTGERAMEIMRDSRVGTYGAAALIVTLGLKLALLGSLAPGAAALLLIAGQGLGRMAAVQVIRGTPYARAQGGKFAVPMVTRDGYLVATLTALVLWLALWLVFGVAAMVWGFVLSMLALLVFRGIFMKRLGGYTGDCLGGAVVLCELAVMLGVTAWA